MISTKGKLAGFFAFRRAVPSESILGMAEKPTSEGVPWFESNLFWGPLGLASGIILTVVAAMKHDLRWLLWFAWPCFGVAIWWLAKRTREVFLVSIFGITLTGGGLLWLSHWLRPEQVSTVGPTPNSAAPAPEQVRVPQPLTQSPKSAPPRKKPIDQPLTPASKPSTDSPASQQPEQPAISAPYGIAIGGGTVNNPTVNNFAPPERHLDPSTLSDSKSCIAQNPGTVEIASIANSPEAYEYASEWLGYFKDAGWRIQDNLIHTFLIGGGVWTGTQIHIRGTYGATGREPKYDPTAPGGAFVSCLMGKKMPDATTVLLEETIATDHVIFEVGPGPAGSLP
jgi:hypothetical protein